MSEIVNIDVKDLPQGAKILDVREDYEWVEGHVEGALHIPLDRIPERINELDPDEDLHVVCRSGGRSARVTQWLTANGYSAVNVDGGMGAWLDAGLPIVSENGNAPVVR